MAYTLQTKHEYMRGRLSKQTDEGERERFEQKTVTDRAQLIKNNENKFHTK